MTNLYNIKTGEKVHFGESITSFSGEEYILIGASEPHKESSTGKVYVRPATMETDELKTEEYYPGVFDLSFENPDS